MNKRNTISGIAIFAFFAFAFVTAGELSETAAYWPVLISEVGMVLSALNVGISAVLWKRGEEKIAALPLNAKQLKRSLILIGIIVVWIFLISRLGYLVSAAIATLAIVLIYEPVRTKKRVVIDIIATLAFSFVMFQLFALLGVRFPTGILM